MDTTKDSRFVSLILGVLLLTLGFVGGWCNAENNCPRSVELPPMRSGSVSTVRSHFDTTTQKIEVALKPLEIIAKANRHSSPLLDSTYLVKDTDEVISCLDTILRPRNSNGKADTLQVCHIMPRDSFWLWMRYAPRDTIALLRYEVHDSLIHTSDTITVTGLAPSIHDKPNWYQEPLEILGALFAGFLLGELRRY